MASTSLITTNPLNNAPIKILTRPTFQKQPKRHIRSIHVTNSEQTKNLLMTEKPNIVTPEFKFEEYRSMKSKQIIKAVDEAVPSRHPLILHESMRYTLLGDGNRLFPILCIAACELVGGNESLSMPMACGIQMITAMAKMQDDLPCLDNDDFRRGKPTNHKVFGEGTTVLACQSLLCLAIEHIATKTKNVSRDNIIRAIVEMCSAVGADGGSAGQVMDMICEGKKEVSLSDLKYIIRHKSGKFVEASVVCGVLMGGGNEVEIERLRKYGNCLGLAFQVKDDVLDHIGGVEMSTAVAGTEEEDDRKEAGRDLLREKATFPEFVGVDESKRIVNQLVAQAKEELSHFDPIKSAPLYHMVNSIAFETTLVN